MKRSLLLNGFMATGKSTVGRLIAASAGVPFVDLDEAIERHVGQRIADIFRVQGEARFRELERQQLLSLLEDGQLRVIAVGGGALVSRGLRLKALRAAVVVSLSADTATILARTGGDSVRPLLVRDAEAIDDLRALRAAAYAEAHGQVQVDGKSPQQISEEVAELWRLDPTAVAAGLASYRVEVGVDFAVGRLASHLQGASRIILLTDETVGQLYASEYQAAVLGAGLPCAIIRWPAGEEHKTPETLARIWSACLEAEADRKSRFIGLGGGVVTDVAGFAAATWMRGFLG